jgi:Gamma tubulin complex component C-terminal
LIVCLCVRSVKHYFLLDQGDFIVQLMDSCEGELSKNIDDIIQTRLEPLLELALRTSGANNDPYKDDMRTQLLPYNIFSHMFKIHSISTNKEEGEAVVVHDWLEGKCMVSYQLSVISFYFGAFITCNALPKTPQQVSWVT